MGLFDIFKKKRNGIEEKDNMKEILMDMIKETIKKWDKDDIYVVSLYVYNEYDNPCEPVMILGYNTMERFKSQVKRVSHESKAKWNYAYWLQNNELEFGLGETQKFVKNWIKENGYTYYNYDEMFKAKKMPPEETYCGITIGFVRVLVEIIKELHSSGFIKEQFGKEIPVLVHELEYYDKIAEQNIEANSKELVEDFVKFCIR